MATKKALELLKQGDIESFNKLVRQRRKSGKSAVLVSPDNQKEELIAAIKMLINAPENRIRIGREGRTAAIKVFGYRKNSRRLLKFAHRLIDQA